MIRCDSDSVNANIELIMGETILVAALGNPLSGDDGAGQMILERLRAASLPPDVHLEDLGSDALGIISHYHGEGLIIILDAINQQGLEVGSVVVTDWANLQPGVSRSAHQLDPVEGINLASMVDEKLGMAEKKLVGVQVGSTKVGVEMTPAVVDAIELAVAEIVNLIKSRLR
jgi:hydrogenase maturation protease